ncbi:hypothetical protein H4R18_000557 [Coemansia javaensis]|uniref:Uncharacterized protein n=1 Tax=Coemansia javaensis TaxID=2761396 RepID=A0A9W8LML1_9FUNG|nr:hypothetical protein H4R18_000557 [Coemansia javaensis]
MRLDELPDEVLHMILRRAVVFGHRPAQMLRENEDLLSVCRRLRAHALPLVHRIATVQCYERKPDIDPGCSPDIVTSLDLVGPAICETAVRRVELDAHYYTTPLRALGHAVKRMRAASAGAQWAAARELVLSVHACRFAPPEEAVPVSTYSREIAALADALAAILPAVCRLSFSGAAARSPVACALQEQLEARYAGQLQQPCGV